MGINTDTGAFQYLGTSLLLRRASQNNFIDENQRKRFYIELSRRAQTEKSTFTKQKLNDAIEVEKSSDSKQ